MSKSSPVNDRDQADDESYVQPLRPNKYLLRLTVALLVAWSGFLIWIVTTS
ncbi:MAG: hypothetical protein VX738_06900 [Planctomycetota bacterium]|nr:hypothetical protein [Planctomycetota bacterium]